MVAVDLPQNSYSSPELCIASFLNLDNPITRSYTSFVVKYFLLLIFIILFIGCATLHSIPSYVPSYTQDVNNVLSNIKKIPLQNDYTYQICSPEETKILNIPEIKGTTIYIPIAFIDYVYNYYYDNRVEIFTCLFLHEISHTEYTISDKPVETHYLVDKQAITLLQNNLEILGIKSSAIYNYHNFLVILLRYGDSIKGFHKHLINTAWNTINAATLIYAGFGTFADWFAYDVKSRILMLCNEYPHKLAFYKRSNFSKNKQ